MKQKNSIFIRCGIEIENYEKALNIIKQQLEDMKKGNFEDSDIDSSKKYVISTINAIPEEQDTEVTFYLGRELLQDDIDIEEYKEEIQNVTKEKIIDLANQVNIHTIYFLRD